MVDVSHETVEQTDARLVRVIRDAELRVHEGAFTFEEFALDAFPAAAHADALALVRDEDRWCQLVPAGSTSAGECFRVWTFHFQASVDNSGFVGWLATRLKRRFGTGVFVVCGQNGARGGIYDHWGCPDTLGDAVVAEVRALVAGDTIDPEGSFLASSVKLGE